MRTLLTTLAIGLAAAVLATPPAASEEKSDGTDLLARGLKGWMRGGDGKSPWRVTADDTLVSAPASDILIPDREFADGTLSFEYRFRPTDKKTGRPGTSTRPAAACGSR